VAHALLHSRCAHPRCNANPHHYKENIMSEHVYKQIELTGSSPQSSDDAVRVALTKATKTLRNIHWFQVVETRGHVEDGKILHWQVTIKVGLRIDD
jgi:flavin-binding protein dodecin